MRKFTSKILVILLCTATLFASLFMTACGGADDIVVLDKPILSLDGLTVSWASVEHADGYSVILNGNTVRMGGETSYALSSDTADDTLAVAVRAYSSNALFEAATSDTLTLKRLPKPQAYIIDSADTQMLNWYEIDGASSYTVSIDGNISTVNAGEPLSVPLDAHTETVSITAHSSLKFVLNSLPTEIELNDVQLKAPTPTVLGALVTWSAVKNAVSYTVYIDDEIAATTTSNRYLLTGRTDGAVVKVKANAARQSLGSPLSGGSAVRVSEIDLLNAAISNASTYKSVVIDVQASSKASIVTQQTVGNRTFNFGQDMQITAVSYSDFVKTARQYYYQSGTESVKVRNAQSNQDLSANWDTADASSQSLTSFKSTFSREPFDFFLYAVNSETITNIENALAYDAAAAQFTFTVDIAPESAAINVKEVIELGGLNGCTYKSCRLTFVIDADMRLLSYESNDIYDASMTMGTFETATTTTQTFSYFNEYQNIETSWIK